MSRSRLKKIRILKFGSSVLRSPDDLQDVAAEVYRHVREGVSPVVVVSAYRDRTNELHRLAEGLSEGSLSRAELLGIGEREAAAAVSVTLERCGLPVRLLDSTDIGISATGTRDEGWPVAVDPHSVAAALGRDEIPVVPGYVARGVDGSPYLLGRGGSDLTAICLGHALSAEPVLIKGSGAVYEWDPDEDGPPPGRFVEIGFDGALALGDRVIQPRALHYASKKQISFTVTGLRGLVTTRVSARTEAAVTAQAGRFHQCQRPARIALLGLGKVGGGVASLLARDPQRYELIGALVRDSAKRRDVAIDGLDITADPDRLLGAAPDIIVETLGGLELPYELARRGLFAGADYVSANKALLASRGHDLKELARSQQRQIRGSASVGGALPALELIARAAERGLIARVRGVLNGTTNFVLEQCGSGASLEQATLRARQLGYAEADVRGDLDGRDAAYKLSLIARELGYTLDAEHDITRDALAHVTRPADATRVRRQVAELALQGTHVSGRVRLADLEPDDPLVVPGAGNAIEITLESGAVFRSKAQGAGRWPTAQSVVADIDDLIDRTHERPEGRASVALSTSKGIES